MKRIVLLLTICSLLSAQMPFPGFGLTHAVGGGGGGISLVCEAPLIGNGTGSITSGLVDCTGSSLTCFVAAGSAASKVTVNATVSDSTSLTPYTFVANSLSAQNGDIGLAYRTGITGSSVQVFIMTGGSFSSGIGACFSGAMGTFDQGTNQYAANTGTASTIQPASITPVHDNEIVIVVCAGAENTISVTSGVTTQYNTTFTGGVAISTALGWIVQTTATAIQPTCTAGSSAAGSLEAGIGSFQ